MKLDRHLYNHPQMVVGGCLSTFLYAYYNNIPVLFIKPKPPFIFDEVVIRSPEHFGFKTKAKVPQIYLWEKLMLILSLKGLIFGSNLVRSIRIEDENRLKLTTEFSRLAKVDFENLFVFDAEQIGGIQDPPVRANKPHVVIDWFNMRQGSKHDKIHLSYSDKFINEVWFFRSKRSHYQDRKDCVVRSYLTEKQITSDNYTETVARIKLRRLLKEEIDVKFIELEHAGREIYYHFKPKKSEQPHITFLFDSPQKLIDTYKDSEIRPSKHYVQLFSSGRDSPSIF